MRKIRRVLAVARAFPLVFGGAVPAFAQTTDSTHAPAKALGVVSNTGGRPTSLPTQIFATPTRSARTWPK